LPTPLQSHCRSPVRAPSTVAERCEQSHGHLPILRRSSSTTSLDVAAAPSRAALSRADPRHLRDRSAAPRYRTPRRCDRRADRRRCLGTRTKHPDAAEAPACGSTVRVRRESRHRRARRSRPRPSGGPGPAPAPVAVPHPGRAIAWTTATRRSAATERDARTRPGRPGGRRVLLLSGQAARPRLSITVLIVTHEWRARHSPVAAIPVARS
jgi:hypothetical protein